MEWINFSSGILWAECPVILHIHVHACVLRMWTGLFMPKTDQNCYEKIQGAKYEVSLDVHMQSVHTCAQ